MVRGRGSNSPEFFRRVESPGATRIPTCSYFHPGPGGTPRRWAEAILWRYQHRSELAAMGRAARIRIEEEFTLARYEERLIELYRSVTALD